jgi:hypothetical protein
MFFFIVKYVKFVKRHNLLLIKAYFIWWYVSYKHGTLFRALSTIKYVCLRLIHIMGLSESTMCMKCDDKEESSYHILCLCPALVRHVTDIFGSAQLQPIDVRTCGLVPL